MKIPAIIPLFFALFLCASAPAATFKEAQVTKVVKQVSIQRPAVANAPASVGERVAGKTAVLTGRKSRTELAFPDRTLLRLGANTRFSFIGADRDFDIYHGSAVFKTDKNSGGARFHFGSITAAITGSMASVDTPPEKKAGFVSLFLFYGSAYLQVGGIQYPLRPWQTAIVPVDKNGNPTGPVKINYFDAPQAAKKSDLMDPNEPVLKENLEHTESELAAKGIEFSPKSGGIFSRLVSRDASRPRPGVPVGTRPRPHSHSSPGH